MSISTAMNLPIYLLDEVASYLDRKSSVSLATTCRHLQDVGEHAAWSHLDLTLHSVKNNAPELDSLFETIVGSKRLLRARKIFIWGPEANDQSRLALQFLAFTAVMRDLLDHLKRHPDWVRAIRTITVDVDHIQSKPFRELLQMTSKSLRNLEIIRPEYPSGQTFSLENTHNSSQLLSMPSTPLRSLRHLQITLGQGWQAQLQAALLNAPYLTSIRISSVSSHDGGWGRRLRLEPADGRKWPTTPYLRRLEVDEMDDKMWTAVGAFISTSEVLDYVALRDPEDLWNPNSNDRSLLAVSQKASLTYLALPTTAWKVLRSYQQMPSTLYLSITDPAVQHSLPLLQPGVIPHCTKMRTLFLHATGASPASIGTATWPWTETYPGLPSPIRAIPAGLMKDLKEAISLEVVHFPSRLEDDNVQLEQTRSGCALSSTPKSRFVLIRTYVASDSCSHGKEELTHCRSFSSCDCYIGEGINYESSEIWEEYTDFEGFRIPASILSRVYAAAGRQVAWTEPGRGLELPEESWEILRSFVKGL